jgi:hypothetical protein
VDPRRQHRLLPRNNDANTCRLLVASAALPPPYSSEGDKDEDVAGHHEVS